MSVRVATLMWGTAWERYGYKFAETFNEWWHPDIELVVVTDKQLDFDRARQVNLTDIDHYNQGKERYILNPSFELTLKENVAPQHRWKYDYMKWLPQAVTPHHVISENPHWRDGDIFVWLDADTEFHDCIDEAWIEKVLGDHDVACLQRKPVHTEIGFYALRLNKKTRAAMKRFSHYYYSLEVFSLEQWHSAFVWDASIDIDSSISINNLNLTNDKTHVFPLSILAEKIVHNKGHRKPGGG